MKLRFNVLDPITLHLFGFMLFMVVPPLFVGSGYHFEGLSLEIIGLSSFIVGALLAKIYCKFTLNAKKLYVDESKLLLCILSFIAILWPIRLLLLKKYGIIALLHPFSRPSSLLDTISQQLSWPYIILLIVCIIKTKARMPKVLLTIEIFYFILPTLSRSYFVLLIFYFFLAAMYYKGITIRANSKKYLIPFMLAFIFIAVFGGSMNAVRSVIQIDGSIANSFSLDIFSYIDLSFLPKRLNMHEEIFYFEPIIAKAIQIDQMALDSLLGKLILFRDYTIHPTEVSRLAGDLIGYGLYTSTDVPRNYILGNYKYGISVLVVYNIIWGMTVTGIYNVAETRKNIMFLSIWSAFVFSQAFGGLGAFPATHIFQFIFSVIAWGLFYSVYIFIKLISTLDKQISLIIVSLFFALMIYRIL